MRIDADGGDQVDSPAVTLDLNVNIGFVDPPIEISLKVRIFLRNH